MTTIEITHLGSLDHLAMIYREQYARAHHTAGHYLDRDTLRFFNARIVDGYQIGEALLWVETLGGGTWEGVLRYARLSRCIAGDVQHWHPATRTWSTKDEDGGRLSGATARRWRDKMLREPSIVTA